MISNMATSIGLQLYGYRELSAAEIFAATDLVASIPRVASMRFITSMMECGVRLPSIVQIGPKGLVVDVILKNILPTMNRTKRCALLRQLLRDRQVHIQDIDNDLCSEADRKELLLETMPSLTQESMNEEMTRLFSTDTGAFALALLTKMAAFRSPLMLYLGADNEVTHEDNNALDLHLRSDNTGYQTQSERQSSKEDAIFRTEKWSWFRLHDTSDRDSGVALPTAEVQTVLMPKFSAESQRPKSPELQKVLFGEAMAAKSEKKQQANQMNANVDGGFYKRELKGESAKLLRQELEGIVGRKMPSNMSYETALACYTTGTVSPAFGEGSLQLKQLEDLGRSALSLSLSHNCYIGSVANIQELRSTRLSSNSLAEAFTRTKLGSIIKYIQGTVISPSSKATSLAVMAGLVYRSFGEEGVREFADALFIF